MPGPTLSASTDPTPPPLGMYRQLQLMPLGSDHLGMYLCGGRNTGCGTSSKVKWKTPVKKAQVPHHIPSIRDAYE